MPGSTMTTARSTCRSTPTTPATISPRNTNAIRLEGWNVVNFDGGVKLRVLGDRHIRVGVNVFNLFETDATTEGSPRQDANQTAGGAYFVGRPVLPRRISGRVTFNF